MHEGICGRTRVKEAASPTGGGGYRVGEAAGSREGSMCNPCSRHVGSSVNLSRCLHLTSLVAITLGPDRGRRSPRRSSLPY